MVALLSVSYMGAVECSLAGSPLPSPLEIWKAYDPDAGGFKEEIVAERTDDGIYTRESYISAYALGEEIRVYCKYAVKAGAMNASGLLDVRWMIGRKYRI